MHYMVMANSQPYAFVTKVEAMEFIGDRKGEFQLYRFEPDEIDGGFYHPLNIEAVRLNLERRLNNAA